MLAINSHKLLKFGVSAIDDVAKTLSTFISDYKDNYGDLPYEEQPKVLFVIDSLGMLSSIDVQSNLIKVT